MKHRRARLRACAFSLLAASGFGLPGASAQTAGPGLVYPPATAPNSFFNTLYITAGNALTLIGPSSSTVVLTSFSFDNWYDNGASAGLLLYVNYSTANDCSTSAGSTWLGRFESKPGQTYQSAVAGGVTLKPPAPGQYWCLVGYLAIQGNPSSYYVPTFGYTANLISGAVPHTATAGVQALPGAVPPIAHQP
ncbi:hypothetical protein [Methylocystis heyeri]|uniref:Secreted protein n=1 Tax=Methylocystis heyeri TaxID=391905 RepID=A0A6B8KD62_9HYPH|nr:hypothetical protein [Methylocystis heyeri]QGM44975.1 hypothetical protein H2LOC_004320 [Methylocystis heyeri]